MFLRLPTRRRAWLGSAAAALAMVAGTVTATAPGDPAPRAEDVAATSTPCARPAPQEDDSSHKYVLTSGGIDRRYVLRLPEGYEKRSDWPLVVAYHGRGSTGGEIEGYSELSTLPAVVAYPEGAVGTGSRYRKAWQGAPYEAPGVDDVAFTSELLDRLQADLCVDPDRTYATGKSNGGGLVALLACRLPDRFAAVAPVAPALYPGTREGCDDAPPVPVLEVHGVADATIPYAGDADRGLPAIDGWVREQAERGGCTDARTTRRGTDVTVTRWTGCAPGAAVEHVAVTGGGHVWPGADVYSGGGLVTHTIETSDVVWEFFSRHALDPKEA